MSAQKRRRGWGLWRVEGVRLHHQRHLLNGQPERARRAADRRRGHRGEGAVAVADVDDRSLARPRADDEIENAVIIAVGIAVALRSFVRIENTVIIAVGIGVAVCTLGAIWDTVVIAVGVLVAAGTIYAINKSIVVTIRVEIARNAILAV